MEGDAVLGRGSVPRMKAMLTSGAGLSAGGEREAAYHFSMGAELGRDSDLVLAQNGRPRPFSFFCSVSFLFLFFYFFCKFFKIVLNPFKPRQKIL
jgi:hypothetical protein